MQLSMYCFTTDAIATKFASNSTSLRWNFPLSLSRPQTPSQPQSGWSSAKKWESSCSKTSKQEKNFVLCVVPFLKELEASAQTSHFLDPRCFKFWNIVVFYKNFQSSWNAAHSIRSFERLMLYVGAMIALNSHCSQSAKLSNQIATCSRLRQIEFYCDWPVPSYLKIKFWNCKDKS